MRITPLRVTWVMEMHVHHFLVSRNDSRTGACTHKPQILTIALEVWGFGPWSKTPHRNTGNDISYVLQDTQRKREGGRETRRDSQRERERESAGRVSGSF